MTSKQDILALADRVEKAEGPDRELDVQIALAVGLYPIDALRCRGGVIINDKPRHAPVYTASLDAAMTLVPEGLHWTAQTDKDGARVSVGKADSDARGIFYTGCKQATAKMPALALASACLRAIAEAGG